MRRTLVGRGCGVVLVLLVGTGCGTAPEAGPVAREASTVGAHGGSGSASMATVRTARCHQWKQMSGPQRDRLLRGMRTFFGGVVDSPGMRGQVLPVAKARRVLDGYCSKGFADQFTLYRLYGDAAAFNPADGRGAPN